MERARFFAKKMDAALAIVDKRRVEMNVAEVMHVIGDVRGRKCLIIDELIDTAGTLVKTANALMENGATAVLCVLLASGVFAARRSRAFRSHASRKVVVTNTIPLTEAAKNEPKIKVLSIAGLIGRAIQSIHEETSVSKLFL